MQIGEGDQKDPPTLRMDSLERISAAADPEENSTIKVEEQDDEDGDLEFSFMQIPESGSPIAADDIFSNGKILPVYPVFNRNLLGYTDNDCSSDFRTVQEKQMNNEQGSMSRRAPLRRLFIEEEREQASFSSSSSASSSSSSCHDELDGISPETYCVWNPNQDRLDKDLRCKKSNSTGSTSSSSRWKLKDLVVGRSKSGGKEKLVFIPMIEKPTDNQEKIGKDGSTRGKLGKKKSTPREVQTMMMRTHYGNNGQDVGKAAGRKSYLPYKRNLLGLFNANGLSPSRDPF